MSTKTKAKQTKPPKPLSPGGLQERAMLADLHISVWIGRKLDHEETQKVAQQNHADTDAGSWWTHLIPKAAIQPIRTIAVRGRNRHFQLTLPWSDAGPRILPAAMFLKYREEMAAIREEFQRAVDKFVREFPTLLAEQKQRLGDLYQEGAYPSPENIASRFGWGTEISPVPDAGDFRVELSREALAEIQTDIEQRRADAMRRGLSELWGRLQERLTILHDAVKDAEGTVRESFIGKLVEICDLIGALNVMGDADLEAARQQAIKTLTQYDAATLRENTAVRTQVADAAADILKQFATFMPASTPEAK